MARLLYEAANGVEAHMIVDLLTQEGVAARTEGEYLLGAAGGLPATGTVRVMVEEDHYNAGRGVIDRWNAAEPEPEARPAPPRARARWPYVVAGMIFGASAVYAYVRTPVTLQGIDHNGDGILDEKWTYSSNNLILKAEADRNLDGKMDLVTRYDDKGLAKEAESDDNFDGVFETRWHYRLNNLQVSTADTNGDGFEDMRTNYAHGVVSSIEYLEPRTGRTLKVEHYKIGRITYAEIDINGDGTMDRRVTFDGIGEIVKTESIHR
jgi:hypothetical protein